MHTRLHDIWGAQRERETREGKYARKRLCHQDVHGDELEDAGKREHTSSFHAEILKMQAESCK